MATNVQLIDTHLIAQLLDAPIPQHAGQDFFWLTSQDKKLGTKVL